MEAILHILGTCNDTHTHIDVLDILSGSVVAGGTLTTLKYYWSGFKMMVKEKLKKIKH